MSVSLYGSGQTILQVVQASTTGTVTTTSTTFVSTGLSATITPQSTTSKILVTVTGGDWDTSASGRQVYGTIYRSGTNLAGTYGLQDVFNGAGRGMFGIAMQYLDSPSTTSATTYTAYFYSGGGGNSVNFNSQGGAVVITLQEVSGS